MSGCSALSVLLVSPLVRPGHKALRLFASLVSVWLLRALFVPAWWDFDTYFALECLSALVATCYALEVSALDRGRALFDVCVVAVIGAFVLKWVPDQCAYSGLPYVDFAAVIVLANAERYRDQLAETAVAWLAAIFTAQAALHFSYDLSMRLAQWVYLLSGTTFCVGMLAIAAAILRGAADAPASQPKTPSAT